MAGPIQERILGGINVDFFKGRNLRSVTHADHVLHALHEVIHIIGRGIPR